MKSLKLNHILHIFREGRVPKMTLAKTSGTKETLFTP